MPESKVLAEYKQRISELKEDEIGHFTLDKGDVKPGTVKMRLLRAAKSLGVEIEVKRFGDVIQSSFFDRFDRGFNGAESSHNNNVHCRVDLLYFFQDLDPIQAGHLQIDQSQFKPARL